MIREIGSFHPKSIRVHYDDEDERSEVEECTTLKGALELSDELRQDDVDCYIDIEARDSNTGAWVRLYLGDGESGGWYFQVQINEDTFREYAENKLATERDEADSRLRALQRLLSVSTKELMEIAEIHQARVAERTKLPVS